MNKLHIITNRISTAITQQPSLKKNIIKDFKFLFYRHNRVILFLVKHFPNNSPKSGHVRWDGVEQPVLVPDSSMHF